MLNEEELVRLSSILSAAELLQENNENLAISLGTVHWLAVKLKEVNAELAEMFVVVDHIDPPEPHICDHCKDD